MLVWGCGVLAAVLMTEVPILVVHALHVWLAQTV
jgi:hypothetical protein